MTDCDIRKKLEVTISATNSDLVVACWGITLGELRKHPHCGEHTQIIRACIETIDLPSLMKQCRRAAFLLWASGHVTVRVMCICDGGMMNSVAVAASLNGVFVQDGFNSSGPHHLSKPGWFPTMCSNCTDCGPSWKKDVLFTAVRADFIRAQWL